MALQLVYEQLANPRALSGNEVQKGYNQIKIQGSVADNEIFTDFRLSFAKRTHPDLVPSISNASITIASGLHGSVDLNFSNNGSNGLPKNWLYLTQNLVPYISTPNFDITITFSYDITSTGILQMGERNNLIVYSNIEINESSGGVAQPTSPVELEPISSPVSVPLIPTTEPTISPKSIKRQRPEAPQMDLKTIAVMAAIVWALFS